MSETPTKHRSRWQHAALALALAMITTGCAPGSAGALPGGTTPFDPAALTTGVDTGDVTNQPDADSTTSGFQQALETNNPILDVYDVDGNTFNGENPSTSNSASFQQALETNNPILDVYDVNGNNFGGVETTSDQLPGAWF